MMAMTHSLAHAFPGSPEPPEEMLRWLNDRLASRYTRDGGMFVTLFYGLLDAQRRELRWACAGHNPPRLATQSGVLGLEGGGPPLGVIPGAVYESYVAPLSPGDTLVLYTDGVTESRNRDGEFFGTRRLDTIIERGASGAAGVKHAILTDLRAFTEDRPPIDDRTLLIARIRDL